MSHLIPFKVGRLVFQIWLILILFIESQNLATCIQSNLKVWIPFKECSFLLAYAMNYRIPWCISEMNCYIRARKCWVWFLAVAGPFLRGFVWVLPVLVWFWCCFILRDYLLMHSQGVLSWTSWTVSLSRYKPFFPFQVQAPLGSTCDLDLSVLDSRLVEGRLKVTLIKCSR